MKSNEAETQILTMGSLRQDFGQSRNERGCLLAVCCSWQQKLQLKLLKRSEVLTRSQLAPVEKPKRMLWAVLAIRLLLLVVLAIKIIPFELLMMKKTPPERGHKVVGLVQCGSGKCAIMRQLDLVI